MLWPTAVTPVSHRPQLIQSIFRPQIVCVSTSDLSALTSASATLTSMLDNINAGGYVFKPTGRAYLRAYEVLVESYKMMGGRFFEPSIVSDGEGGIDIEWARGGREVLVGIHAYKRRSDYVYYQTETTYGGDEFSQPLIKACLRWLLRNE